MTQIHKSKNAAEKKDNQLNLGPFDTIVFDQVQQSIKMLRNFLPILDTMEQFCSDRKIEPSVLLETRLAADQFPFKKQIQLASDSAKFMASRLSGKTAPAFEDHEITLEDLRVRISKTIDYLSTFKIESFEKWEAQMITVAWHEGFYIPGKNYFYEMAIPNFYFHITTAYSILRERGLIIGKADYLGNLPFVKF